ncbi:phage capsid family protein [Sphingomonas sp. GB1N7]|uniref:phage capsid family protein n=1 Tax=Parasphingomonas caseinilytica TaxID=3096158 RepID=UPI002FCB4C67
MASFKLVSANEKQVWSAEYTSEYVRESGLLPYMGTTSNSIIRVTKELQDKSGATIHLPYFAKLSGPGVTGGTQLMGAEENLKNYSTVVRTTLRRNGVKIQESETYKTELDVANAARSSLLNDSSEKLRNDLLIAGQSVVIAGGLDTDGNPLEDTYKAFVNASAAEKNAWLVANTDRILCGNVRANTSSGVLSTSLGNITAAQKLSAGVLNMAKTMAKKSNPFKITPYKTDATAGREWYVLACDSEGFRDVSTDATIYAANQHARAKDVDTNPIFQSGDLIYNGIIIREIPELVEAGLVGASGARVGHALLMGQNAIALAYSKMAEPRTQVWDYGMESNVAIVEVRGQSKMSAAGVQTGMVSIFHASALDA